MRHRLHPEERRSQLIATTIALLEADPGIDLIVEDVAAAAQVSRALVYRYFAGVDELLRQAKSFFFSPLNGHVERVLAQECHPREQLRSAVGALLDLALHRPHAFCALVEGASLDSGPHQWVQTLLHGHGHGRDVTVVGYAVGGLLEAGVVAWLRNGDGNKETATELLCSLAWTGLRTEPPKG